MLNGGAPKEPQWEEPVYNIHLGGLSKFLLPVGIVFSNGSILASGVDGLKFLPQLWTNVSEKRTKTRSIHVHKLDFIALLNDCFWIT